MIEKTLIIIKPDALDRGLVGRIISRFEDKYFNIVKIESRRKNIPWAKLMWPHLSPEIFKPLAEFMTDELLIGIVLAREEAVIVAKELVGPVFMALPGTIRGDFSGSLTRCNCVHCSDKNPENEIRLFFNE